MSERHSMPIPYQVGRHVEIHTLSPQEEKCLRGEHQAEGSIDISTVFWYKQVKFCRHCRCIYVEKGG